MKTGLFAIGMVAGSVAGIVATTLTMDSMHPGMLARDGRRMARKFKQMTSK